ncbi:YihY/virulence factor BrkB family protein [Actinomycetes bacterium NPDC127524]
MAGRKEWMKIPYYKELIRRLMGDDVSGLAAQLAYFFLLSLFPLLLFLMALLPYLPISQDDILNLIRGYAPSQSMSLIEDNLRQVMKGNGKLLSFGIIATIWSASNGISAIVQAFNRAYDVKETRPFITARAMSILLTIAMVIVFVVALLLPVFGRELGYFLFSKLGFSGQFFAFWNSLRWLISSVVLFLVFLILYLIAPNKRLKCVSVLPGAIFATAGWSIVSLAFSFYVRRLGHYTATYGGLGGIIVLMTWFYLTGLILIIGGEINAMESVRKKPNCE